MSTLTASLPAQAPTPATAAEIIAQLNREGYVVLPGVLTPEEIAGLRQRLDSVWADPTMADRHHAYGDYVMVRLFELDRMFRDLLVREPIISLVEAVLGNDCHLIANNAVRNRPGQALDFWHADDTVFFPVAPGMTRHDARLTMPIFILTAQILLSDVPSDEYGPTQYVPGSHYAGRQPDDAKKTPSFEGRGPVSVLGKAGDIYLHNGQCWHRGSPNTSTQTRYLLQQSFGRRWVAQRFYPFLNYHLPHWVLEGASERLLRVLGKHPKGAYG